MDDRIMSIWTSQLGRLGPCATHDRDDDEQGAGLCTRPAQIAFRVLVYAKRLARNQLVT
jgi:hypothetical protein